MSTKPKKIDRRILRTRRMLGSALESLIMQGEYATATVTDITEAADLNRATFYLHYASKEELLIATLESRFNELIKSVDEIDSGLPIWEDNTYLLAVFEHVAQHAALYRALFAETSISYVTHRILDYITEVQMTRIRDVIGSAIDELPMVPIATRSASGSLYAVVTWWLTNDMPYSATRMADMVLHLHQVGAAGMFQIDHDSLMQQAPLPPTD